MNLIAVGGHLALPNGDVLMYAYPFAEGICETPEFDRIDAKDPDEIALRGALYNARETGSIPSDCREVTLPDGQVFQIE